MRADGVARGGRRQGGRSLLELVLVVGLVLVLIAVAAERIQRLHVDMERARLQQVVGQLRAALAATFAERVVRGGGPALAELDGINPMTLVAAPPGNYLGERDDPPAVASGHWYFDPSSRVLVYRVEHAEAFVSRLPGEARFRAELVFADADGDGGFDPAADSVNGVRLEPVAPYRWRDGTE